MMTMIFQLTPDAACQAISTVHCEWQVYKIHLKVLLNYNLSTWLFKCSTLTSHCGLVFSSIECKLLVPDSAIYPDDGKVKLDFFGSFDLFHCFFISSIATPTELTNLVKFWTGWEILPTSPSVEVVMGRYPTASTCFEMLRIPGHYKDYQSFQSDIQACICSCQTGFGLV